MNNKLDLLIEDSESILDNLNVSVNLATVESKLDELVDSSVVLESMLENLNVVIDVTTLESKLDACCFTTNGKLDLLLDDVSLVESLIIESDACIARSLTDLDVTGGRIVLSTPGNYCIAHDIGTLSSQVTVSLVADNITLCMNNRQLMGAIEIYGAYAQVKNGTVSVPSGESGITVASTAFCTHLSQLTIACDTHGLGTALVIAAPACSVNSSFCTAGGTGGDGIALYGVDSLLQEVQISSYSQGGGHGIACYSPATRISIKKCSIDGKDELLVPGTGSGIFIAPGCTSIEVRDCTLARTANFAVEDNHVAQNDVSSYSSVIYNNFAYDSANSSATYQIRNKRSMGQSYGVDLVSGSPGLYSNVYVS